MQFLTGGVPTLIIVTVLVVGCSGKIEQAGGPTGSGTASTPPSGSGVPTVPPNAAGESREPPPSGRAVGEDPPPSAPVTAISCGTTMPSSCDATTQECCLSFGGTGYGPNAVKFTCVAKGSCGGSITLACTSAANCSNGQVCCADIRGLSGGTTCEPSPCANHESDAGVFVAPVRQVCVADVECGSGNHCVALTFGYGVCVPN